MCGIAGFVDPSGASGASELEAVASRMSAALHHRGPDDSGTWTDPEVGLAMGHARLAVMDGSPRGHQPMVSSCGRHVIAYNGEIYNCAQIRNQLDREAGGNGHPWRGHSDTEVLLAAVGAWGVERARRATVGMFAFALWDRRERCLHLARDRFGEKPLYLAGMGKSLLFGSELKALRRHPAFRGDIDRDALAMLMRHNYVPAPFTIYKNIWKLMPGTWMSIPLERLGRLEREGASSLRSAAIPYSSAQAAVQHARAHPYTGSIDEAEEELDATLRVAVAQQMVADVPLGAFLSGGVDSSLIVSLMQAQSTRPVRTFTIGFHEAAYNEATHAEAVARHLGTEHTEWYVAPREAREVIPSLPDIYDEPFSDASQIPTLLVSKLARKHVTVSLSGDAGDEIFGGYTRYLWGRSIWRRIGWMPYSMRSLLSRTILGTSPQSWDRLAERLGPMLPRALRQRNPGDKDRQKLGEVVGVRDAETMYLRLVSHWKSPSSVVPGSREPTTALTDRTQWPATEDFTERMMYLDTVTYLPNDILVKVDRAAMSVALESRIPFLDHGVFEFAWRLPLAWKIARTEGKILLRRVLHSGLAARAY